MALPAELVHYLDFSPLPVFAWHSTTPFDPRAVPYHNPAALGLFGDVDLLSALDSADDLVRLTRYLHSPDSTDEFDAGVELQFKASRWPVLCKAHRCSDIVALTLFTLPGAEELEGYPPHNTSSVTEDRPTFVRTASSMTDVSFGNSSSTPLILEEAEDFLRMSKHISIGMAKFSLEGRVVWVNEAWLRITGLERTPEALSNWTCRVHPDDLPRVLGTFTTGIATLSNFDMKWRWVDGSACHVTSGLDNEDPAKATCWIGTVIDITEEERAKENVLAWGEERMLNAQKAAEESEARRQQAEEEKRQQELLIDVSSHELRNPVSAIQQNAELTRQSLEELRAIVARLDSSDQLPQELQYLLVSLQDDIEAQDAIFECASLQGRIANDILGLAQIQHQRFSITPVPFELITNVRTTLKMIRNECKANGIDLELSIGSSLRRLGPKCRIDADPTRLSQIVVNLLTNAVRFTVKSPVRKIKLSLEVSAIPPDPEGDIVPPTETEYHIAEKSPIYLFFSVEDTGAGMSEEEKGRIFLKFQQASPLTHTQAGGSGLGLWIARNLCELQKGRVEVLSTLGKGSTFRCFIAARSVDAGGPHEPERGALTSPTVENIVEAVPNTPISSSPVPRAPSHKEDTKAGKSLKVLCCEDNRINRTVLQRQLTKVGHTVVMTADGKEGYTAFLEQGPFDRVLMDVEMPVMNGLEATLAIRACEATTTTRRIRIVGLTGNAREAQIQACLDAGMDSVITKPYRAEQLLAKLQREP